MWTHHERHVGPARKAVKPKIKSQRPPTCSLARCSAISMYESELEKHKVTETKLKRSIIREKALLQQKDELIRKKDILSRESEHRLLNGLQLITSLLSMQSRQTQNAEAAAQLAVAANRVAAIGRVHHHLHALDRIESVAFKQYLDRLCCDLSGMAVGEGSDRVVSVEGIELEIPTVTAIPLGFIASELVTNAIKYAKGRITVKLHKVSENGYALSVSDDGPGLPEGFNPAATQGLGMKIVTSLARQIGGQMRLAFGDGGKGTQVSVLFS